MIHRFIRFIPALIIGVAIIGFSHINDASVHAETNVSQAITLSPASTDIAIDPGSSAQKSVDVINSGNDPFSVKVTVAPYYVSGENYDPHFTQLPGTIDASQWLHLPTTQSEVQGTKTITIPYTVTVPKGTPAGGYYAVVFVETDTDNQKTGVVSHNRVGDILYITVNGDIKNGGSITGSSLPVLSFIGTIPIGAKVSNSGGTHFITSAHYSVTNMNGKEVFNATIERYILPQTEREITTSWSPQALFGIFTIHRSATINGKVESLPNENIVVINPWLLVIVAFLIGILIGVPFQRARRRRQASKQ